MLATGYKRQEELVRKLFGDEVADARRPDLGLRRGAGTAQHVCAHGQPGLWFIAGSLAQCRINSKYLALQIKAIEEGLLPARSQAQLRVTSAFAGRANPEEIFQEENHMPTILGSGEHRYRVVENLAKLPQGWTLTDVASVRSTARIASMSSTAAPIR